MDRVRVLKWVFNQPGTSGYAVTKLGKIWATGETWRGIDGKDHMAIDGLYANMDHAESDYLDRISEFVPVLKPGQVGVDRELVEALIDVLPKGCNRPIDGDCIDDCGMGCLRLKLQSILDSTPAPDAETETQPRTQSVTKPEQDSDTVAESADKVGGKTNVKP